MKTILNTTAIMICIFLISCETFNDQFNIVIADDEITSQQRELTAFQNLNVESAITVHLNFSDTDERFEIEANRNIHQYIEVFNSDDELTIRLRDNVKIRNSHSITIYITSNQVKSYSISGASRVILHDQLSTDQVEILLSGASTFNGDVSSSELICLLSGASKLDLTGNSSTVKVEATGASTISGSGFECNELDIYLSGASNAEMSVNTRLDVKASGASILRFRGAGMIYNQTLSGESKIIRVN